MGLFSWLGGKKDKKEEKQAEAPAAQEAAGADDDEGAPGVPLEELAAGLSSRDGARRADASRALLERWQQGDAAAADALFPKLADLLDDDEAMVRVAALSAVQLVRKKENLEALASPVLALLADPVARVRTGAIYAAVRIPGEAAQVQCRALLAHVEEPMRFAAATAFAQRKDPVCLPVLLASLREEVRRQEALSSLMALGDPAALPEVARLFEDERLQEFDKVLVAAALARFGDARGGEWLHNCITEEGDVRPIAAEWAGRLGVQAAIPALEELAGMEREPARGAALRALGRLKAPGAEERLLQLARDEETSPDLRMDAAEGLAELGTPAAKGLLENLAAQQGELAVLCRELLLELAQAEQLAALEKEQAAQAGAAAEGQPSAAAAEKSG
jgi:HEAT repeat protein